LLTLCLFPSAANAQNDFYYPVNPDWRFRASLGFGLWDSQRELDTVGGEFDDGPFVLELGIDYRLTEWGNVDIYAGLDGGFMTTASDILGIYTSPTSDVVYFAPSVALYFGEDSSTRFNFRAGAGRYSVEFSEWIDNTSLNRSFSETEFGLLLGAGVDFPLGFGSGLNSITLETRAHFVDFGPVQQLGPDSGNLDGPIWTFQFGWGRRF
jgi:hypothetical protein